MTASGNVALPLTAVTANVLPANGLICGTSLTSTDWSREIDCPLAVLATSW